MKPDLVADVGNTCIKWGRCTETGMSHSASLPPDDRPAWQALLETWGLAGPQSWAVAGVHQERRDRLADWLRQRGDQVRVLEGAHLLPLSVQVDHPDRVGIDRLLNAVAANTRRRPGAPAVIIDAGSAVTVDWLDDRGAFRGGAIFPGMRLMAEALHDYTDLLPRIEMPCTVPGLPGTTTPAAMAAGIYWTVFGGIQTLTEILAQLHPTPPDVFLTGGDGLLLCASLHGMIYSPTLTLEGIRLVAETLP